jgi:hypothetical protein
MMFLGMSQEAQASVFSEGNQSMRTKAIALIGAVETRITERPVSLSHY